MSPGTVLEALKLPLLNALKALRRARALARRLAHRSARRMRRAASRAQKRARRLPRRCRRALRRLRRPWRRLREWGGWVTQALDPGYRVPGERDDCPACGTRGIRYLGALPLRVKIEGRRAGFMCGCPTCGLVFANPMPSAAELAEMYAPRGDFDSRRTGVASERAAAAGIARSKLRMIFADAPDGFDVESPAPGCKALDFGCGDGGFLNSLQDLGWRTYGIEPSSKVAFARHEEIAELPIDPTFDLVIVHHVMEHLRDPLETLRRVALGMNEGGLIYVSVPRLDALPRHGDLGYCIHSHTHIVAYSEACMRSLMVRAGLEPLAGLHEARHDRAFTSGRPVRLRVLARKSTSPGSAPARPLDSATRALAAYYRRHAPAHWLVRLVIPVRLRASVLNTGRQVHSTLSHRRERRRA